MFANNNNSLLILYDKTHYTLEKEKEKRKINVV